MFALEGIAISPGFARGMAIVYDFEAGRQIASPCRFLASAEVEGEWLRIDQALENSHQDLQFASRSSAASRPPADVLSLLEAHATMTSEVAALVKRFVDCNRVDAEQALEKVIGDWIERLTRLDSVYLRQREQDLRDVGRRLKRHLAGSLAWRDGPIPKDAVIVTRELMPSEVIEFANCEVAAVVSERGGRYSHTAILARSLGLPAITRVLHATSRIQPGMQLLVDGEAGQVVVNPSPASEEEFAAKRTAYLQAQDSRRIAGESPCMTSDGSLIGLHANVGRPQEIASVVKQRLDGVGLFRTEFLFMESVERPERESQAFIYATMAKELDGRPLVVRTFDLGRDKIPPFLMRETSDNATLLHLNGLQFSLAERNLFYTQIAAILDAAQTGDVRILLPMVIGGDDFSQAVTRIEQIAERCNLARSPMIGAMIETPAALFGLDEILDRADFLALGTNDLAQFMLATDRDVVDVADDCTAMHPAVLRAIHHVCEAAARRQCPVSVCGEAAGEADFACLMIGMGVEDLSVDPSRIPALREVIQAIDSHVAKMIVKEALVCRSPREVGKVISQWRLRMKQAPSDSAVVDEPGNTVAESCERES